MKNFDIDAERACLDALLRQPRKTFRVNSIAGILRITANSTALTVGFLNGDRREYSPKTIIEASELGQISAPSLWKEE